MWLTGATGATWGCVESWINNEKTSESTTVWGYYWGYWGYLVLPWGYLEQPPRTENPLNLKSFL